MTKSMTVTNELNKYKAPTVAIKVTFDEQQLIIDMVNVANDDSYKMTLANKQMTVRSNKLTVDAVYDISDGYEECMFTDEMTDHMYKLADVITDGIDDIGVYVSIVGILVATMSNYLEVMNGYEGMTLIDNINECIAENLEDINNL